MPPKPRTQGKRKPPPPGRGNADRGRMIAYGVAGAGLALLAIALLVVFGSPDQGGGGPVNEERVRTALAAADCELEAMPAAEPGDHSVTEPGGTSDTWQTDPPTNGAHYGGTAVWGAYDDPLEQARVVHNLEHGGVYIQYGEDVPEAAIARLRTFYDAHERGTLLAPLPGLGDEIALGAWVYTDDVKKGFLARCTAFDQMAFTAFFEELQFKGPERFSPSQMLPGSA